MQEIVKRTIDQAIKLLNATGAKYKVIDKDGNEFGDLVVSETKKTNRLYPRGAMFRYYHPLIKDMKIGDVVAIESGEFTTKSLQGAITSWATATWGKGSYTTCVVGSSVQILRYL